MLSSEMPTEPSGKAPPLSTGNAELLLAIHLAEYQALMNRATYWISIQYISYSVAAVLLTLIVSARGTQRISGAVIVWGGLLTMQLLAWAWVIAVWETHAIAVYLDQVLRLKIEDLLPGQSFWGWEPFLAAKRRKGFNKFESRFGLPVLLIAAISIVVWLVWKVTPNFCDWHSYAGWLVTNLYVTAMITLRFRDSWKLQSKLMRRPSSREPSRGD